MASHQTLHAGDIFTGIRQRNLGLIGRFRRSKLEFILRVRMSNDKSREKRKILEK